MQAVIYNNHNDTNLYVTAQCLSGRHISSAVAGNTIGQFAMMHISYYLLTLTYQWKQQFNGTAYLLLANNWIQTFLLLLINPHRSKEARLPQMSGITLTITWNDLEQGWSFIKHRCTWEHIILPCPQDVWLAQAAILLTFNYSCQLDLCYFPFPVLGFLWKLSSGLHWTWNLWNNGAATNLL